MGGFVNRVRFVYLASSLALAIGYLGRFLLTVFVVVSLTIVLLYLINPDVSAVLAIVLLSIGLIVASLIYEVIMYIFSLRRGEVWSQVEREAGVPEGRIRGAYEVCLQVSSAGGYSHPFVARAAERANSSLKYVFPLSKPFDRRHMFLSLIAGAFVMLFVLFPSMISSTGGKVVSAYENLFLPQRAIFTIEPEGALLHRGDDLEVSVLLNKGSGFTPYIEVDRGLGEVERFGLKYGGKEKYTIKIEKIMEDTLYRGVLGNAKSGWYKARVVREPSLEYIRCEITEPAYAGTSPMVRKSMEGEIFCLSGSRLDIEADIGGDVEDVYIMHGESHIELKRDISGMWRGSVVLTNSGQFSLVARDILKKDNMLETAKITITPDNPPSIKLVSPKGRTDVATDLILTMSYSASDDYGISTIGVEYIVETTGDGGRFSLIGGGGNTQISGDVSFDLNRVDPLPGDTVLVRLYALDNDTVAGPKVSYSETVEVRIPDIVQFFRSVDGERDYLSMEEVLEEGEAISEMLTEIAQGMEERGEIDYESYSKMEEVIEREKNLRKRAEEILKGIDEMRQMGEEGYLSEETLYKLSKAQEMLEELIDEQTKRLLEEMQKIMEELPEEEVARAMREILENQEELNRRLDTMLRFLENAKVEMLLDSLKERLRRTIEEQKDITEGIKRAETERDIEFQSEQQEKVKRQYEEFLKEMEDLMEEAEGKEQLSEELGNIDESGMIEKPLDSMERILEELSEYDLSEALSSSGMTERYMEQLYEMLKGMGDRYLGVQRERLIKALEEIDWELSQIQASSSILEGYAGTGDYKRAGEMAEKLHQLLGPIGDEIECMMAETLFLNPQILSSLEEAGTYLEGASGSESGGEMMANLGGAQEELGRARGQIGRALEGIKSASSPSGLSDFLRSLSQVISNQGEMGEMLREYLSGKGAFDYNALMSMAAMQRAIRESLERLLSRYQSLGDTLKGLEGAIEAMKKIEGMLNEGAEAERIKEEQKHLMERLLRSEKAIKSRGISRERKSTPGKDYVDPTVPPILPAGVNKKSTLGTAPMEFPENPYGIGESEIIYDYFRLLTQ
ncbi:MAG: hypothetical protein DRH44_05280 [Candidatus Coatesbacteria bacterium]|nr:MAG: hypothetical protein DRH44_05280 [Candidatus Coatesbacteria bacterium]